MLLLLLLALPCALVGILLLALAESVGVAVAGRLVAVARRRRRRPELGLGVGVMMHVAALGAAGGIAACLVDGGTRIPDAAHCARRRGAREEGQQPGPHVVVVVLGPLSARASWASARAALSAPCSPYDLAKRIRNKNTGADRYFATSSFAIGCSLSNLLGRWSPGVAGPSLRTGAALATPYLRSRCQAPPSPTRLS